MAGNSLAFHNLTPESLYWLGWLATDGCIYWNPSKGYRIQLKLQKSDKALVERFADFVGAKPPIPASDRPAWVAAVVNNIMGAKLSEYGITPNKSSSLEIKNPEIIKAPEFWRGAFEGDGSFRLVSSPEFRFTSVSCLFLEQFREFCPVLTTPKPVDLAVTSHYVYTCAGNARRLVDRLYLASNPATRLERKWEQLKIWTTQYRLEK